MNRIRFRYFWHDLRRAWLDFRHGLRSLRLLFGAAWEFREWDYRSNYELFARSLQLTRDHIARHQNHTEWERDVASIESFLEMWRIYENTEYWKEEELMWDELHDHLKRTARGWWD